MGEWRAVRRDSRGAHSGRGHRGEMGLLAFCSYFLWVLEVTVGVSAALLDYKAALGMKVRYGNGKRKRTDTNLVCHLFYVRSIQEVCKYTRGVCVCAWARARLNPEING